MVLAEPVDSLDVQGCKVVYDLVPNAGSLGGLYTGLMASSQPRYSPWLATCRFWTLR